MSFSLVIPKFGQKGNSTKEKVVSVLATKWPLSTKEIFFSLKNEFGFTGSYQAIHKVIKELLREQVIKKDSDGFLLDVNWIENLNKFSQNLKESYSKNTIKNQIEGTIHLKFGSFLEYARFLAHDFFGNQILNPQKKPCVCFWEHVYGFAGIGKEEHEELKKILSYTKHYGIARNNSAIDNFFAEYYEKLGKKCAQGTNYSVKNDTFVQGDYILQAFFPTEMTEYWNKICEQIKNNNDIHMQKFFEFAVDKKYQIEIIIFKNKEFAESLIKEAKKIYEERKK